VISVRRRGARLARREEEEYSTYCDDEQRRQPGWIGGEIVSIISGRALSTGFRGPEQAYASQMSGLAQKPGTIFKYLMAPQPGTHSTLRAGQLPRALSVSLPSWARVLQIVEDLNEGAYQLTDTAASAVNGCWEERLYQDSTDMAIWDCLNGHYVTELLMLDGRWANFKGTKTVQGDSIPVAPIVYNNCHDKSYLMYRVDRRKEWESQSFDYPTGTETMAWYKLQPYAIALLTAVGVPMLWMGEDMAESYGLPSDGPSRVRGVRFIHWENFYTPYEISNVASPVLPLTTLYRNLCKIRNDHPALRGPRTNAVIEMQDFGRKVAVFRRWLGPEIIIVAVNFSDAEAQVSIPFGHRGGWVDLLSACYPPDPVYKVTVSDCQASVTIPSNFGRIFRLS
jgi:maltooligosyltrehalose trehalohydrolase